MTWIFGAAKQVGISHQETGAPCQDSFDIERSEDGKWVAVAVCDGAGSAKHSEVGSNLVSKTFAKKLILLSKEVETRQPGAWINDFVIQQILNVREELRAEAKSDDLRDFHTTLVAFLMSDFGGFAIHIGDGSILGGIAKDSGDATEIDSEVFMSKPENGEYSNETFFITEGDWIKHLRITPMPPLDWVFVGTDGGSAFFADPADNPKQDFITSFIADLKNRNSGAWSQRIGEILSDKQADKITNDDKTLIFFAKEGLIQKRKKLIFKSVRKIDSSIISTPKPSVILSTKDRPHIKKEVIKSRSPVRVFLLGALFISAFAFIFSLLIKLGLFDSFKYLAKLG